MRCNITKMNVLFLVDGSGSVTSSTFREFKTFMKLLVMKFTVGRDATDVGVLQYSSKDITGLEFAPGEYQTIEAIQNAISKVKYHYGAYTYAGYAMGKAKEVGYHEVLIEICRWDTSVNVGVPIYINQPTPTNQHQLTNTS